MIEPVEVTEVMMAFPANVIPEFLPPEEAIPEQYWKQDDSWQARLVKDWFFSGLKDPKFYPKEGVDPKKAFRHIRAILGSFQPQHEHKEAGCRYLVDLWFEKVEWERAK